MADEPRQDRENPDNPAQAWLEVLLILLVFFVAAGDAPPHRNEAHYLAKMKHAWNPEWCQGDFFLESPDAHLAVVWLFGWVTKFVSLDAAAWIGRLVSWSLLAWAWRRLSWRIVPLRGMVVLSASLLVVLTEQTHLAGEWLIGGFEAKTLSFGCVFLALRDAIDRQWNRAWLLLGVAGALHALVGAWSTLALLAAWWGEGAGRTPLRAMAPGLVIGALVGMIGVAPALALNRGVDPTVVDQANQTYVFMRLPHHLAPLSKPPAWVAERASRHAIVVVMLMLMSRWWFTRERSADTPGVDALRMLARFAWCAFAFTCCGIAIELIGWNDPTWSAALLRYYWFRLGDIALPLVVSLACCWRLAQMLETERMLATRWLLASLALCAWCIGGHAVNRALATHPPADQHMRDPEAWVEACKWITENTEPDAVFLTPRSAQSFKWRTGRPEVVTYKDIPQNAEGLVEWRERFLAVHRDGFWPNGEPRFAESVSSLGSAELVEIATRYGAGYALSEDRLDPSHLGPRRRASLPVVYRQGPYTLYDLRTVSDNGLP